MAVKDKMPTQREIEAYQARATTDKQAVERLARLISPEWFTEDGSPPLINNYPDQHKRIQEAARHKARDFLASLQPKADEDVVEIREVLEILQREDDRIMDGGDGPFVELWESDFQRVKALLERLAAMSGGEG